MSDDNVVPVMPGMALAERLGISERELEALLWVRDEMASGSFMTVTDDEIFSEEPIDLGGRRPFNMQYWQEKESCGTVCCIGGWMARRMLLSVTDQHDLLHHRIMSRLFIPPDRFVWGVITPEQAVRAIDNFTTHMPGDPGWDTILTVQHSLLEREDDCEDGDGDGNDDSVLDT